MIRQQVRFNLYGQPKIAYAVPTHTADPEFAWFTDVLWGANGLYVFCEVMKIGKDKIISQLDAFAETEEEIAAAAFYGDSTDD